LEWRILHHFAGLEFVKDLIEFYSSGRGL